MEWHHRQALILILPLVFACVALALYARSCRRKAAEAFVATAMWNRILPAESNGRFWLKLGLLVLGSVFALLAIAEPRFGEYYESIKPHGSDLYIAIDVSRSMLATDVAPSRLGRAKADVSSLLNHLHGERVGLIAFAGKAAVKCPLTTDYTFFRLALDELGPGSAPRGGTAIGDAIRKALEVFPNEPERDQALLLITDGDDQDSYAAEAADSAAERRVTIFTVGLGDAVNGAPVPTANGGIMEYKGQNVTSKLDSQLLTQIALKTNGVFVPVGTRAYDLSGLYENHLKNRRGADVKEARRVRLSEQYQIFLALAVLCFIAEILVRAYPPATDPNEVPQIASVMTREKTGKRRAEVSVP